MLETRKFISAVEKCPALYQDQLSEFEEHELIWQSISKRCNLGGGYEAYEMWTKILQEYIDYLRDGNEFEYIKEMRFMQAHLCSNNSESEDVDEEELQRILDSESDASESAVVPPKKLKEAPTKNSNSLLKPIKPQPTVKSNVSSPVELSNTVSTPTGSSISGFTSLELTFLSYAKILQELPPPLQIQTKHKIAEIVHEMEKKHMQMQKYPN